MVPYLAIERWRSCYDCVRLPFVLFLVSCGLLWPMLGITSRCGSIARWLLCFMSTVVSWLHANCLLSFCSCSCHRTLNLVLGLWCGLYLWHKIWERVLVLIQYYYVVQPHIQLWKTAASTIIHRQGITTRTYIHCEPSTVAISAI
jgi:hypothetical protein